MHPTYHRSCCNFQAASLEQGRFVVFDTQRRCGAALSIYPPLSRLSLPNAPFVLSGLGSWQDAVGA